MPVDLAGFGRYPQHTRSPVRPDVSDRMATRGRAEGQTVAVPGRSDLDSHGTVPRMSGPRTLPPDGAPQSLSKWSPIVEETHDLLIASLLPGAGGSWLRTLMSLRPLDEVLAHP